MLVGWVEGGRLYYIPKYEAKLQEALGITEPVDLWPALMDIDFALVNSHPVLESVFPRNANTALIGGLHVKRTVDPIKDEDLKKWLDEAEEGVIYVSYGSVSQALLMPKCPLIAKTDLVPDLEGERAARGQEKDSSGGLLKAQREGGVEVGDGAHGWQAGQCHAQEVDAAAGCPR